jgi:hypothetical protein
VLINPQISEPWYAFRQVLSARLRKSSSPAVIGVPEQRSILVRLAIGTLRDLERYVRAKVTANFTRMELAMAATE